MLAALGEFFLPKTLPDLPEGKGLFLWGNLPAIPQWSSCFLAIEEGVVPGVYCPDQRISPSMRLCYFI